jgi:MFS family permease
LAKSDELQGGPEGSSQFFDYHARTLGVVLLALGLIIGFVGFYFPIHDAYQGAENISYYPKAVFLCVTFTLVGLAFIILGPIAGRLFLRIGTLTGWKKWLAYGLLVIPLIACAEVVQYILEQYLGGFGYKF